MGFLDTIHGYSFPVTWTGRMCQKKCFDQEVLETRAEKEGLISVGQNLFRTSNLLGSCWPEAPLFQSWGSFFIFMVWVRAIYCFLNQSCESFLELPAHRLI